MTATSELSDVDLVDPSLYRDGVPHEVFTGLRAAGAVHRHRPVQVVPGTPETSFWSVVRHTEVQQANRSAASPSAKDVEALAAGLRDEKSKPDDAPGGAG